MAYQLLTGATGLLGSYLLRDLLLRGQDVAVLIRPTRYQSPEQRVEQVLGYWEDQWQRPLPRPVVVSGDIATNALGVTHADCDWVRQNCRRIIHSAASLTFVPKKGEPWRTNVDGVENLLQFCHTTDIREFVHVSSAYVCGLRDGVVSESELDVGQAFGNDYERSKVKAEQLVQADPFLEKYVVFRPSIIVGAFQTGHTLTYHGFYTPLRLIAAMMSQLSVDDVFSQDHLAALGLRGHERKNLVPVDWVSDAMLSILDRPHSANTNYALVSSTPVTAADLLSVFEESVRRFVPRRSTSGSNAGNSASQESAVRSSTAFHPGKALEKMLWDQFTIYQSYWRDDPQFDDRNARFVIPDKPCPELNRDALLRLCRFAIEAQFTSPLSPLNH